MKTLSCQFLAFLLIAGCAAGVPPGTAPSIATASDRPAPNYFDYRIDPSIVGRYGITGEVAWQGMAPGQRPRIIDLGEQIVTFQRDWPESIAHFSEAFDATVRGPLVTPGTPDGVIPAKPTNNYYVTFRTENVTLDGFDELGENSDVISGGWVFSSEKAAKVMKQILRMRKQYEIAYIGFNFQNCNPEVCGPDGSPVPTYPSTDPKPTPAPTPKPRTEPLYLRTVTSIRNRIPLGKEGVLRVTASFPDLCGRIHEVRAIVDDEQREVRLEATATSNVDRACPAAIGEYTTEVTFSPSRSGTYRVIWPLYPHNEIAQEMACEVEVVEN